MQSNDSTDFDSLFTSASKSAQVDKLKAKTQSGFERDCLWIVNKVQNDVDNFPRVVCFVLLTIQQAFHMMPRCVADVARHDTSSRFLWGWKPDGLAYARANKHHLWRCAVKAYNKEITLNDLILEYLAIPGLGIVKASFLAQMTVGDGACLDTVNLQRLGLDRLAFRSRKNYPLPTILRQLNTYNATWRANGTCAQWWDSWCDSVSERETVDTGKVDSQGLRIIRKMGGTLWKDSASVSRTHRLAITGGIR